MATARRVGTVALVVAAVVVLIAAVWVVVREPGTDPAGGGTLAPSVTAPPASTPSTPAPAPTALIVGDSFTAGANGVAVPRTFACLTAARLGWRCRTDAEGDTGYLSDGRPASRTSTAYLGRLAATRRYQPTVVMVTGGYNDGDQDPDAVAGAVARYYPAVRASFPRARLIAVGPFWVNGRPAPSILSIRDAVRAAAERTGATFVDPIAGGWIDDANAARYIGPDGVHPTAAGHAYLAARLAATIKAARTR